MKSRSLSRLSLPIKNVQMVLDRTLSLIYKTGTPTRACTKFPHILGGGPRSMHLQEIPSSLPDETHLRKGNRHGNFQPRTWDGSKPKCLKRQDDETGSYTDMGSFYLHWNEELKVRAMSLMYYFSPDNVRCSKERNLEREEFGRSQSVRW